MEDIEMRDFAVEAIAPTKASELHHGPSQLTSGPATSFWKKHIRITIDEQESRDHLALERTFLAYIRTASAFAQFGVTVAQLFKLNSTLDGPTTSTTLQIARAMGATTEAIAILILLIGATYFAKQQSGIMKGMILSRGWDVITMGIVSFVLFSVMLGLLATANN